VVIQEADSADLLDRESCFSRNDEAHGALDGLKSLLFARGQPELAQA
jgi:hypothetical protein